MSGPRYIDWSHIRVEGDRDAAAAYVGEARKLMGAVMEDAAVNGLGVHAVRKVLPDGTVITAEKLGDIPRITIATGDDAHDLQDGVGGDFVVWARDADLPDGIHPDYPQQILQAGDGGWTTYFYSDQAEGYEDFDRAKGTYLGMFPSGVPLAGQVDWRGPAGERVSWYGPSTRYWFDAWRQPSAQYGRFVFYMGQILLDVDKYLQDNDLSWEPRLVVGAAIRRTNTGRRLFVMLADIPDQVVPQTTVPPATAYISQNYPLETVQHRLVSFLLARNPDRPSNEQWSVVDGSADVVWAGALERACSPWVFNPGCTRATTFSQPQTPLFAFSDDRSQVVMPSNPPPAESVRIDLDFEGTPALSQVVETISVGAGEAAVAVDYGEDGGEIEIKIARGPHEGSPHAVHLVMGQHRIPIYWLREGVSAPFTHASALRRIVSCDARAGAAAFDSRDWYWDANSSPGPVRRIVRVEVFEGGQPQATVELDDSTGTATALARYDRDVGALESTAQYPLAPLAWVWGVSAQMTSLLLRTVFIGLSAPCTMTPFHPDDTFGQFGTAPSGGAGLPSTPVSDYTAARTYNSRQDRTGNRSASGFAAVDGLVVMSMYDPRKSYSDLGGLGINSSVGYATGAPLPEITGVAGVDARYHPCWLLGKPIGGIQ